MRNICLSEHPQGTFCEATVQQNEVVIHVFPEPAGVRTNCTEKPQTCHYYANDILLPLSSSLYPVVPGNGRLVSEAEVVVGNYRFPKKV